MPAAHDRFRPIDVERADSHETGATAVEYAIIASLIAAVIIAAVYLLGQATEANFSSITDLWP